MSKKFLSGINVTGTATLNTVADAGTNTDKFLVLESSGAVSYRTAAELYIDLGIGNLPAGYTSTVKHEVKAAEVMSKGQAVYISSSDGTNMIASKASNSSESTSSKTMGLLETSLSLNGKGNVITEGLLSGLNTNGANAGDPVWLGTNGNLIFGLLNKPTAPSHLVFIGIVTRANSNNGEIFVKVQNGFEMGELHNYAEGSVANNEVIVYESATSLYKPKSIATILGYTPADASGYVPYTGATQAVDLGAYNLTVNNVKIGRGSSTHPSNIAIGNSNTMGYTASTGSLNIAIGNNVLFPLTTGYGNVGLGVSALSLLTTGYNNTSIGNSSGNILISGAYNTFIGRYAGGNVTTGGYNTILGSWQGTNTINYNVVLSDGDGNVRYRFDGTNNNFYQNVNFGSTLGNGTYTYTLPGATGTLALTSDIPSLSGYVPTSRTITINGTTYDLSSDRSWTVSANQNARTEYEFTTDGLSATYSATYTVGQVDVFYNGSKLASTEFTATTGTSVVLGFTPPSGQIIEIVAWQTGGGVSSSTTITINGTTYDLSQNRSWTISTGLGGTGTANGVAYFSNSSTLASTSDFYWDNTNKWLGIGTNAPSAGITSYSTSAATQFKAAGAAPAITFSNTLTSPTLGASLGLVTAVNNFVNGTIAGELVLVNQSATERSIVFGIGAAEKMRLAPEGCLAIGTTIVSNEANLFLGAKSTTEGGQLVLQKATSYTYAAHIDNYCDNFRIISGTNTASVSELLSIGLSNGYFTSKSSTSFTSGNYDVWNFLAPNQTGGAISFNIGKSLSTYNNAAIKFTYAGNNSTSNRLGIGFYDRDNILNILASGNVGIDVTNPTNKLQVSGNIYSTDTVFGRNLKPEAWTTVSAGSPSSSTIPLGYSTININSVCDNSWRTVLANISDAKFFMWVTLGDAASKDTASYSFAMTSPAYGVSSMANLSYTDGGWNTGGFEFTYSSANGTHTLLVRCSSYYNSGNTAYGTIHFLRLE